MELEGLDDAYKGAVDVLWNLQPMPADVNNSMRKWASRISSARLRWLMSCLSCALWISCAERLAAHTVREITVYEINSEPV